MGKRMTEDTIQINLTSGGIKKPYVLLKPVNMPVPTPGQIHTDIDWKLFRDMYVKDWEQAGELGFDFETNGLPVWHPQFQAVGLGVAWFDGLGSHPGINAGHFYG